MSIRAHRMRMPSWLACPRAASHRALHALAFVSLLAAGASPSHAQLSDSSSSAAVIALGVIRAEAEQPLPTVVPQNLGPGVNTRGTELGPVIAPDGRTLYFTRGGAGGNQDIWSSTLDAEGRWTTAVRMPAPLTNAYNNFVESVTPDGNTLLVGGRYLANAAIVTGLSMSHRTRDGWSVPEPLRIRNYYSRSRSVSSCLGSDGETLVMSLERDSGRGRQDLYVSFRRADGEWSEPMNLGPTVNSGDVDFAPFLAADGTTLYFSSKGRGGYGDADIFVTRRLDSSWQNWSAPQNLGGAINSQTWDAYYVIPASGDYVYFGSSSNSIGESDLVRVPLPSDMRPRAVALVSGRVVNSVTNEPVAATIRYERLPDGEEAGVARTDPRTGRYAIALPAGEVYAFRAEAPEMLGTGSSIDLTSLDAFVETKEDLAMVPFEEGQVIGLANIFFDFGQSTLRAESYPELDRLVDLMNDNPTLEIEVAGHTDHVGSSTANARLSEARVGSVVTYLLGSGVAAARLHTNRFGETKPVADNVTNEGRQRNRRVEFRILRR
jgi:outer membrane protein OmpA-like peptidoglycan-associated protein/Tol biopolymer transport system component